MSVCLFNLSLTLAASWIPELNGLVLSTCHNEPTLKTSACHCVGMSFKFMNHLLLFEVPERGGAVPATCDDHAEQRVLNRTANRSFMAFLKTSNWISLMIDRVTS